MSSSFGAYYNEYTNNPSPASAERLQQKPSLEHGKTFTFPSKSKSSNWSKCLWISFVIFAFICLLAATIIPLVIVLKSTSQITSNG